MRAAPAFQEQFKILSKSPLQQAPRVRPARIGRAPNSGRSLLMNRFSGPAIGPLRWCSSRAARRALGVLVAGTCFVLFAGESRAGICKVDGQVCSTNQSCCGRACVDSSPPGKRPKGICCTPTTCAEAGANCGSIPNGTCAGTIQCGTCGDDAVCGL